MSIKVMTRVWEHSQHKGSNLLLLLAIADNAREDGVAWPGQKHLAEKIRMSERTVRRLIGELVDSGELEIVTQGGSGPKATTRYRVTVQEKADNLTTLDEGGQVGKADTSDQEGGQVDQAKADTRDQIGGHSYVRGTVNEPSVEPSREPSTPQPPQGAGDGVEHFEAMFERFWQHYPKKVGKKPARLALKKHKPDSAMIDELIAALETQKATDQWRRGIIPNPATWINQERWNDEIDPVAPENGPKVRLNPGERYTDRPEPKPGETHWEAMMRVATEAVIPRFTSDRIEEILREHGLPLTDIQRQRRDAGERLNDYGTPEQRRVVSKIVRDEANLWAKSRWAGHV